MREPRPDDALDGPALAQDVLVHEATRVVLASDKPIRVMEGDRLLGVVGQEEILGVIAEVTEGS